MEKKGDEAQEAELPDDLILEILRRLALKAVFRFRCVSKGWKSMIDDNFAMPNPSEVFALFVGRFFFDYIDNHRFLYSLQGLIGCQFLKTVLTDCCNGLLLLRCNFETRRSLTAVLNPSTKEYAFLPDPYLPQEGINFRRAALAFDPCLTPHYKVIQFSDHGENRFIDDQKICYFNAHIFSSETWSWTKFKFELIDGVPDMVSKLKSVYLKGAVYKLSRNTRKAFKFPVDTDSIASCSNSDGSVRVRAIPLPTLNIKPSSPYNDCLGVATGNICYACSDVGSRYYPLAPHLSLKIWMLKSRNMDEYDDEYEWVLKFSTSIRSIAGNLPIHSIYPSAFDPSRDRIFLGFRFVSGAGRDRGLYPSLYSYDLITQKLERHRRTFSFNEEVDFSNYSVFPCVTCSVPVVTLADLIDYY